jgi:hypothetical protein
MGMAGRKKPPGKHRAKAPRAMDILAAAAAGIRSKRKGAPRGKSWKKGEIPPGAKPFPPGVSGNPNGRPAEPEALKDLKAQAIEAAPRLMKRAIELCESGLIMTTPHVRMFENLWALAGFPIPRKVELSGPNSGPVAFEEIGPGRALLSKLAGEAVPDEEGDADEEEQPEGGAEKA